jgi:hypothetical protein
MILALAFAALVLPMNAAEFDRQSAFASVEAFVTAAKAFPLATTKSNLSSLFAIPEMGAINHGKPITAPAIQSCNAIWSGDDSALVLAVAIPPTEATRSSIGVLFLLVRQRDRWHIADLLRFTATGKEAEVSAELTAYAGTGYRLGTEGMAPVVTVKESHGGRGYAYQAYASYTLNASKLKRLELK